MEAALGIGLAGPRWSTGIWQPPRMLASDYVVFFHAWFALLFLVTRGELGLPRSEPVRSLARAAALSATALDSSHFPRMDPSDDPAHWKNGWAARTFGLRSIVLARLPERGRDEGGPAK